MKKLVMDAEPLIIDNKKKSNWQSLATIPSEWLG